MRNFFILLLVLLSACTSNQAVTPSAKIEFRPASFEPQNGATAMMIEASQQKVYVFESILISTPDIAEAVATFDAQG